VNRVRAENIRLLSGGGGWLMLRTLRGCEYWHQINYTPGMTRDEKARLIRGQRIILRGRVGQQLAALRVQAEGGVW